MNKYLNQKYIKKINDITYNSLQQYYLMEIILGIQFAFFNKIRVKYN